MFKCIIFIGAIVVFFVSYIEWIIYSSDSELNECNKKVTECFTECQKSLKKKMVDDITNIKIKSDEVNSTLGTHKSFF